MSDTLPQAVVDYIRALAVQRPELPGITTAELAEALGVNRETARNRMRRLVQEGVFLPGITVGLTFEQAQAVGYLSGCRMICYRLNPDWIPPELPADA